MATINQSSGQGALFELVARGVKDAYFVKDSKESSFPYNGRYDSSTHHLGEKKRIVPLNQPKFGATFEVELDPYADILTECSLVIDLPTWLPPLQLVQGGQQCSPRRVNGLYWIKDQINQFSYGYVNYVGYLLFERIQFYQDQILLQEWSGDGLLAKAVSEGSWNSSFLDQTLAGLTPNDPRSIALRATPNSLMVKLPLPGIQCPGDGGFPLICTQNQTYRFKVTLRKLEDLVVCSNSTLFKPAPWNVPAFTYTNDNGYTFTDIKPLSLIDMGQPTILLETVQRYVAPVIQQELKMSHIQIPFRRQFQNNFTFGEADYKPLDNGGVAAVTRRLDGRHPTEKLFYFFRNQNSLDNNRLDNFVNDYIVQNPYGGQYITDQFYNRMKLVIAGKDREHLLEPFVWQKMNQFCKDEKASGLNIGEMKWSLGEQYGTVYPAPREPEGTVNFTTADRPTLYIELANIVQNLQSMQRKSEMLVFTEGWAVYEMLNGRGRLIFAN